ncbi:MAG: hypothetical protein HYX80_06070 [Chloroflexi bacterium]|nr:hypothetical protein [Chloroflexota bacterium]
MKTDNAWFGVLLKPALNGLREYYTESESRLLASKNADLSRIRDKPKSAILQLDLKEEQRIAELDIELQQHEANYDILQANFLRYSFVILTVVVFTDHLERFCQALQEFRHYQKPPPTPDGDVIGLYRRYIREAGIEIAPHLWDPINDLNAVRNCIVHSSGDVTRSRYRNRVQAIAQRDVGIHVSSSADRNKPIPLYLSNNRLIVEPRYCYQIVDDVANLLVTLCKAARIPTLITLENGGLVFKSEPS